MNTNNKIISNLENLFQQNYQEIKYPFFNQWLDLLKQENPDIYSLEEQKTVKLYEEESLNKFDKAKTNQELIELYETVTEFSLNEDEIINKLSVDLISTFQNIKKVVRDIKDSQIQIIILSYNEEPCPWISGFGEGDYPILKKPEYFDYNFNKTFFETAGKLDYSCIWKNLSKLEKSLDKADIYDEIVFHSDFYQKIKNSYVYKTYILLNKAFRKNQEELFKGLNIKKPLFIYGQEHGCERINIFSYE